MSAHQTGHEKSNLKVGLTGLGIGIIWILVVSTIAFSLAMRDISASEHVEATAE